MFFILLSAVVLWAAGGHSKNVIIKSGLTCDQKQAIVNIHNQLRDKVAGGKLKTQPKAANMIEMKWNDKVAATAQKWSDGCVFKHDTVLRLDGKSMGQNLASLASSRDKYRNPDLNALLNLWISEVHKFGYNGTFTYKSGHYSQMIWGKSDEVGCGLTYYKDDDEFYTSYLVCNYLPAGNYIGEAPYVYGTKKCKAYNLVDSSSYSNLCATSSKQAKACR